MLSDLLKTHPNNESYRLSVWELLVAVRGGVWVSDSGLGTSGGGGGWRCSWF